MILFGTKAAKLLGFLPPHRQGWYQDIDLWCSPAELAELRQRLNIEFELPAPRAGRVRLFVAPRMLEIDTAPRPSIDMILAGGDLTDGELFGMPAKIAGPAIMYLHKRALRRVLAKAKHDDDIKWLRAAVRLKADHLQLYRQILLEYRQLRPR